MKIINKSVDLSRQLLNKNSTDYQHFAFIFYRNKLLAIGQNNTLTTHPKCVRFAKRFGAKKPITYPYKHAEIDVISKLWGKEYVCAKHKLVSIRLNKYGELRISKPCEDCSIVLKAIDISVIYFDGKGFVV